MSKNRVNPNEKILVKNLTNQYYMLSLSKRSLRGGVKPYNDRIEILRDKFIELKKNKQPLELITFVQHIRLNEVDQKIRLIDVRMRERWSVNKSGNYVKQRISRITKIYTYSINKRTWYFTKYDKDKKIESLQFGYNNNNHTFNIDHNLKTYFKALLSKYITEYLIDINKVARQEFFFRKAKSIDLKNMITPTLARTLMIPKSVLEKYKYRVDLINCEFLPEGWSVYDLRLRGYSLSFVCNVKPLMKQFDQTYNDLNLAEHKNKQKFTNQILYMGLYYRLLTEYGFVLNSPNVYDNVSVLINILSKFDVFIPYSQREVNRNTKYKPEFAVSRLNKITYVSDDGEVINVFKIDNSYTPHTSFEKYIKKLNSIRNKIQLHDIELIPIKNVREFITKYEPYLSNIINVPQTLLNLPPD